MWIHKSLCYHWNWEHTAVSTIHYTHTIYVAMYNVIHLYVKTNTHKMLKNVNCDYLGFLLLQYIRAAAQWWDLSLISLQAPSINVHPWDIYANEPWKGNLVSIHRHRSPSHLVGIFSSLYSSVGHIPYCPVSTHMDAHRNRLRKMCDR